MSGLKYSFAVLRAVSPAQYWQDVGKPSLYSEDEDEGQFVEDATGFNNAENQIPELHSQILNAAENGALEALRRYLQSDPDLVNVVDNDHYTPLHRAAYNNKCDAIKTLLDKGANVNARTLDGWTPLHSACRWQSTEAAALLLSNGADINAQTNGGVTPLHLAASYNDKKLLELLLYNPDVDLELKNNSGDTAYDIALRSTPLYRLFKNLV